MERSFTETYTKIVQVSLSEIDYPLKRMYVCLPNSFEVCPHWCFKYFNLDLKNNISGDSQSLTHLYFRGYKNIGYKIYSAIKWHENFT